ncbi:MAG: hypothetical protein AAFS10_15725, partial [Myxococcota bacterium]
MAMVDDDLRRTAATSAGALACRRKRALAAVLLAVSGFWLPGLGCSEANLEPIPPEPTFRDDKITIEGALCTRAPETLSFPLRVLFVVDSSVSMERTDPPDPVTGETGRERAVRETWERL